MGNFKQTSNVSITITKEYTSRSAVNNEEAHTKQLVMSGNAKQEFKKYNYEFPTQFSNMKYRDVIWKNLRTGTKYDKSSLTEEEFWAGRVYKSKNCGKTTTYLESMTFAPPWRIHVYCIIKLPKVAKQKWTMLHVQIGQSCKHIRKTLWNGVAPEW